MAARNLSKPQTLDRGVVLLYGGGTGAGAANMTGIVGPGIQSITRSGVGLYTINIADRWHAFLMFTGLVLDPTAPDDWEVNVVSETVAGAVTRAVNIIVNKSGAATDLTTDEKLKFELVVSNTSVPPSAR